MVSKTVQHSLSTAYEGLCLNTTCHIPVSIVIGDSVWYILVILQSECVLPPVQPQPGCELNSFNNCKSEAYPALHRNRLQLHPSGQRELFFQQHPQVQVFAIAIHDLSSGCLRDITLR